MDSPETLLADHGRDVWRTICRILGGEKDADDCFQDAFTQYLQLRNRRTVAQPAGMLKRIAIRRAIDQLRLRSARVFRAGSLPEDLAAARKSPVTILADREFSDRLRSALCRIDPTQATVFALTQLDEVETEEVAKILETTTGNIAVLLHRARAALRRQLAEFAQTPSDPR